MKFSIKESRDNVTALQVEINAAGGKKMEGKMLGLGE